MTDSERDFEHEDEEYEVAGRFHRAVIRVFGPIHPYRWLALTLWIIAFTVTNGYAVRSSRENTNHLRPLISQNQKKIEEKASVPSLQKTNCAIKQFLVTLRASRVRQLPESKGADREAHLRAISAYNDLIDVFTPDSTGYCPERS